MRGVFLAERALLDVAEASEYLDHQTGNPEFGHRLVIDLKRVMHLIAENPGMGRLRTDLQKGLRSFPHGHYTIFWRLNGPDVEIVRVLHQRQDVEREFGIKPR
jgi:toxin ParE1/3/4